MIMATASEIGVLEELGLADCFDSNLEVPLISTMEEYQAVLEAASNENFTPGGPLIAKKDITKALEGILSHGPTKTPIKKLLQLLGHASSAAEDTVAELMASF